MKKIILIDGNSILHRSFHAIPPFHTSSGQIVNAVYGFTSTLFGIFRHEKPDYIAVAFDVKGKTFRHEKSEQYKATRVKAPDELYEQIPTIKKIIEAFEIPIFELQGYEADDLLGTLAVQSEKIPEIKTFIFTSDKDALQLVTDKINVISQTNGVRKIRTYTPDEVEERYGLNPSQIVDMKALQGDSSDNIKGISGIGEKTARNLLQKYGTLEKIYNHLEELAPSIRNKMIQGREDALLSKDLAKIDTDAPKKLEIEKCKVHDFDREKVRQILTELEFKSLKYQFDILEKNFFVQGKIPEKPRQKSLF